MEEPSILFEDEALFVLNKPSGITVNRSDTTAKEETVQDWIEKKLKTKSQISNISEESDFYRRLGIVHRLDKETSGILLVAKTPFAFEELQRQFKEKVVKKTYTALVHGEVVPASGEINVPIGRLSYNRKRFGIVAGGRDSVTEYRTIRNFELKNRNKKEIVTLLELYPQTGRTHQIRVHLKYLNHPVFADELYAGRKTQREDRKVLPRLFLHAAKIAFFHPMKKEEISFTSDLPSELKNFLDILEPKN